jgi:hypothetical protein
MGLNPLVLFILKSNLYNLIKSIYVMFSDLSLTIQNIYLTNVNLIIKFFIIFFVLYVSYYYTEVKHKELEKTPYISIGIIRTLFYTLSKVYIYMLPITFLLIYPTIKIQEKYDWCKNIKHLPFDFVLEEKKIIIDDILIDFSNPLNDPLSEIINDLKNNNIEFNDNKNDVIGYYENTKLVAFSLLRRYDTDNVEAIQFAWNYENPSLQLGIESLKSECAFYKDLGFRYLYLGGADEYKKKIDGFEILGPL